jgi:hypothetical protein
MTVSGRLETYIYSRLTSALAGAEWSGSCPGRCDPPPPPERIFARL